MNDFKINLLTERKPVHDNNKIFLYYMVLRYNITNHLQRDNSGTNMVLQPNELILLDSGMCLVQYIYLPQRNSTQ